MPMVRCRRTGVFAYKGGETDGFVDKASDHSDGEHQQRGMR